MGKGIVDIANTSLIFWEVITFLILLFLLYWFVWPSIRDQIRQRQESIERAIDEAEQTRKEAHELLEDYRRQIEEAARRPARSARTPASRGRPSASGPRGRLARRPSG